MNINIHASKLLTLLEVSLHVVRARSYSQLFAFRARERLDLQCQSHFGRGGFKLVLCRLSRDILFSSFRLPPGELLLKSSCHRYAVTSYL